MKTKPCLLPGAKRNPPKAAFTFTDLLAVLGTLALAGALVLPALAQTKPRSQQAICFNNLRALLMFDDEIGSILLLPPRPRSLQTLRLP